MANSFIHTVIGALVLGCASAHAALTPLAESELACPATPNCVNSLGRGGLAPLSFQGTPAQGMAQLKTTLATLTEATVVRSDATSLSAVFTTLLGFRDEVEFRLDAEAQTIHFRSRSLMGAYDFGKNHSRMQDLKSRFEAAR
jgi:uncharacterized protein (DUF1499 family)